MMKCIRCDIDMLPSDALGNVCPNCGTTETEQEAAQKKGKQDDSNRNKSAANSNPKRPNR
jgi:uncharacterized Zn finger protein (UPF0148 family)